MIKEYNTVDVISALVEAIGLSQLSPLWLGLRQATQAETRAEIKTTGYYFIFPAFAKIADSGLYGHPHRLSETFMPVNAF